jgi:hypothetical protein
MPATGGAAHHPGMDPLSLVPAIAWLVVVPVALGLGFRWLAGEEADDATPIISTLLTAELPTRAGPRIREPEFVPFRLDAPRAAERTRASGRTQPKVSQPSPV